eukprot:1920057-Amphidinium_carterae.1
MKSAVSSVPTFDSKSRPHECASSGIARSARLDRPWISVHELRSQSVGISRGVRESDCAWALG